MSRKNPKVNRSTRREVFVTPQRLTRRAPRKGMMIQSELHGDMQRLAEMTSPPLRRE